MNGRTALMWAWRSLIACEALLVVTIAMASSRYDGLVFWLFPVVNGVVGFWIGRDLNAYADIIAGRR